MAMTPSRTVILLYSDDATVRGSAVGALGDRLSPEMGANEIHEFATADALHAYIDSRPTGQVADLIIVDGEAVPEGGMGISRQLKDEIFNCPPVLLITARPDDAWLATWARADGTVLHPIDPFTFGTIAAALLAPAAISSSS